MATANPILCNLQAISDARRPRYHELVQRLHEATRLRTELSAGYQFTLDNEAMSLTEAAEWIEMERLCCPFLTFELTVECTQPHYTLTLTGPEGVKPLL